MRRTWPDDPPIKVTEKMKKRLRRSRIQAISENRDWDIADVVEALEAPE